MPNTRMYKDTKTWNPAVGCEFECVYCKYSFQAILKRFFKGKCDACCAYIPHEHPERLKKIPTKYKNIFVFGNGDFSFYKLDYIEKTIQKIKEYLKIHPDVKFYFQTKDPIRFYVLKNKLKSIEDNVIFLTTLETNRDEGYYESISRATIPSIRARAFSNVEWKHKYLTIEPILKFDLKPFLSMILEIDPEKIYLGLNSRHSEIQLPEPTFEEFWELHSVLENIGYEVILKNLDRFDTEKEYPT